MKHALLIFLFCVFPKGTIAQKVIHNPDCIYKNFTADVTKVEIKETETILHFHIKETQGMRFSIPSYTYIEDSSKNGERLYILRGEGVNISQYNTIQDSKGMRYKLYFPPLGRGVTSINYGEANYAGHWFIYKLNIKCLIANFNNYI